MRQHWKDISDGFRRINSFEETGSGETIMWSCSIKLSSAEGVVRTLGDGVF